MNTTTIQTHEKVMNLCCKLLLTQAPMFILWIKLYWSMPIYFYIFCSCFNGTIAGLSNWDRECMAHRLLSGPLRKNVSAPVLDSHFFATTLWDRNYFYLHFMKDAAKLREVKQLTQVTQVEKGNKTKMLIVVICGQYNDGWFFFIYYLNLLQWVYVTYNQEGRKL